MSVRIIYRKDAAMGNAGQINGRTHTHIHREGTDIYILILQKGNKINYIKEIKLPNRTFVAKSNIKLKKERRD